MGQFSQVENCERRIEAIPFPIFPPGPSRSHGPQRQETSDALENTEFKERTKDRKPPPIKLIKESANTDTLTTPDINKAAQTPLLREVFNRNQEHLGASEALANLGDLSGNIKEEIVTSNPPSVSPLERDVLEGPDKVMDKGDEIITMQMTGQEQTVVKQVALRVAEQATLLPTQPVDMTAQEVEKVERKRQRNRVAATKCRKRKIERITVLEGEVKNLNDTLQKNLKEKESSRSKSKRFETESKFTSNKGALAWRNISSIESESLKNLQNFCEFFLNFFKPAHPRNIRISSSSLMFQAAPILGYESNN